MCTLLIPTRFFELLDAAELSQRPGAGGARIHTGGDVLVDLPLDVDNFLAAAVAFVMPGRHFCEDAEFRYELAGSA